MRQAKHSREKDKAQVPHLFPRAFTGNAATASHCWDAVLCVHLDRPLPSQGSPGPNLAANSLISCESVSVTH